MTPKRAYRINLSGKVFDSWTTLCFCGRSGTSVMWLCECICGTLRAIRQHELQNRRYKSCGCLDIRKGWIIDGVGYIPLTRGQVTTVSPHRVEELQQWNWQAVLLNGKYYAYRRIGRSYSLHMARQILNMDRSDEREADHIDNERTLDNRDENLRVATKYQNLLNKAVRRDSGTGVKGVRKHKVHGIDTGRFQVRIGHNGVGIHLALCDTLEEGKLIYAEAARKLHGEFRRTE